MNGTELLWNNGELLEKLESKQFELEQLKSEKQSLQEQFQKYKGNVESINAQIQKKVLDLSDITSELKKELQQKNDTIIQLNQEIEHFNEIDADLEKAKKMKEEFLLKEQKLLKESSAKRKEIQEKNEKIFYLKEEIKQLKGAGTELQKVKDDYFLKQQEFLKESSMQQDEIWQKNEIISQLSEENERLKEADTDLQKIKEELLQKEQQFQTESSKKEEELQQKNEIISQLNQKIEQLNEADKTLQEAIKIKEEFLLKEQQFHKKSSVKQQEHEDAKNQVNQKFAKALEQQAIAEEKMSHVEEKMKEVNDYVEQQAEDKIASIKDELIHKYKAFWTANKVFYVGVLLYGILVTLLKGITTASIREDIVESGIWAKEILGKLWGIALKGATASSGISDKISMEGIAVVVHWILYVVTIIAILSVPIGILVFCICKFGKYYYECLWDRTSLIVLFVSLAVLIYFSEIVNKFISINIVFMLILVQVLYVGIRKVREMSLEKGNI